MRLSTENHRQTLTSRSAVLAPRAALARAFWAAVY